MNFGNMYCPGFGTMTLMLEEADLIFGKFDIQDDSTLTIIIIIKSLNLCYACFLSFHQHLNTPHLTEL